MEGLDSPAEFEEGFFWSGEDEAAPAAAVPEGALTAESPELVFEPDGAAGFLPLESFT